MSAAKDKDRILAEIKAFTPHQQIAGLDRYLSELEREGLVKIWPNEQHEPIIIRLTKYGQEFVKAGGYSALQKQDRAKSIRQGLTSTTGRIIEASIIAALTIIIAWWLNSSYGVSDNPVGSEQNALNQDSTSLSLQQSSGLKADSVASLGKSADTCRESSLSTLDRHSIGIPVNETSAKHSSVREESNPTPSGK